MRTGNWFLIFLLTWAMHESHTGSNITELLKYAMDDWNIKSKDPAIDTDNASNMTIAVQPSGLLHFQMCRKHLEFGFTACTEVNTSCSFPRPSWSNSVPEQKSQSQSRPAIVCWQVQWTHANNIWIGLQYFYGLFTSYWLFVLLILFLGRSTFHVYS